MPAIFFYDVVLAVHIMAVVIAFGVIFAYPIISAYVTREHPRFLPGLHTLQGRLGRFLITPAATVALLAGFYMASDRDYMGKVWVVVPLVILIAILASAARSSRPTSAAPPSWRPATSRRPPGRPGHALAGIRGRRVTPRAGRRAGVRPGPRRHLLHGGEARRLLIRHSRA